MEYRNFPKTNEKISVIGLGMSSLDPASEKNRMEALEYAFDQGINYVDMAAGYASAFESVGKAIKDRKEPIYLQVHFGADYTSGEYGWTTNLDRIKKSVAWQLGKLGRDYIDIGMIHCIDEMTDLETYKKNGVLDYILDLKEKGIVHHIGLSTHNPKMANAVLDLGLVDLIMFSINPLYDESRGDYGMGSHMERKRLYARCKEEGVAISVMKPFASGKLINKDLSNGDPILSRTGLIHYALDQDGVLVVLPGAKNKEQVKDILHYFEADENEKEYHPFLKEISNAKTNNCVYCSHCHPCPAGLDIVLINKYYDLYKAGDVLAKEHYLTLEKTAKDCLHCGHCNSRCPFHVDQMARMDEILKTFGI